MKTALLAAAFYLAALVVNATGGQLFKYGLNVVYEYQQVESESVQWLNRILSDSVKFGMYAAAGFLFLSRHRLQAFNLVALLVVSLTLQTNLKLAFAQIRPFWYWPDIRTIGGCPFQTGLPSGHSSGSVVIFWVLYYHAFPYLREAVSLILLILTGGAIAQSRLGLGAHSVNQIVFGLLIGLATVVIYDTWGRAALHSHLVNRLRTPTSARYLALVFGLHLLYCGAVALNYYCISHLISNPAIQNINRACGKPTTAEQIHSKELLGCDIVGIFFGLLYAVEFVKLERKDAAAYLFGMYRPDWKLYLKVKAVQLLALLPLLPILAIVLPTYDSMAKFLLLTFYEAFGVVCFFAAVTNLVGRLGILEEASTVGLKQQ